MATRRSIPPSVEADILDKSRRRCAICYAVNSDKGEKKGQLAHLDRNPRNNDIGNLVFLCLDHHDAYDSTTSQSKGISTIEVKRFRDRLYEWVKSNLPSPEPPARPAGVPGARASPAPPNQEPSARTPQKKLEVELAKAWGMTRPEVQAELGRIRTLLEQVGSANLPSRQLRLLEFLVGNDRGNGPPRRVVEVGTGYDYLSREFFDEMSVLIHFGLATHDPEVDDLVYLNSHETWMSIAMLSEKERIPVRELLGNPDPTRII